MHVRNLWAEQFTRGHSDNGYEYADIISAAKDNDAQFIGSMMLFPTYTDLNIALSNLQGNQYSVNGYRTHLNGGKKIYWGVSSKESNIITFTLIKVSAGSNLGRMVYLVTDANMNENVDYNNLIDNNLDDIEAGAGAQ